VFQRIDPKKASGDLATYVQMTETLHQQGVPVNEAMDSRMRDLQKRFDAVARGEQKLPEGNLLFDPFPVTGDAARPPSQVFTSSRLFAGVALGIGLLAGIAWLLLGKKSAPA
jgi:hypothetical protein